MSNTISTPVIIEDMSQLEYEEDISTDEEYEYSPRSKKPKLCEQERKQGIKIRQIEKCVERKSREPGDRLGKNAKKITGRRAFIDNWADTVESGTVDESNTDNSQQQKSFERIKRKPGHRQREMAFCEN
jgi:hypothetical protein